jgi:hypothetical protein
MGSKQQDYFCLNCDRNEMKKILEELKLGGIDPEMELCLKCVEGKNIITDKLDK